MSEKVNIIKIFREAFVPIPIVSANNKKLFQCAKCPKTFKQNYLLKRHLQIHSNERPFRCSECRQGFRQKPTLIQHMSIHNPTRLFECKICSMTFTRHTSLISHRPTHGTVKQFRCDLCQKGFHQRGNLRNHMNTHTDLRPYKCVVCETGFNQQSNLSNHVRNRHPEIARKYACGRCDAKFVKRRQLRDHEAEHRNGKVLPLEIAHADKKLEAADVKVEFVNETNAKPDMEAFNDELLKLSQRPSLKVIRLKRTSENSEETNIKSIQTDDIEAEYMQRYSFSSETKGEESEWSSQSETEELEDKESELEENVLCPKQELLESEPTKVLSPKQELLEAEPTTIDSPMEVIDSDITIKVETEDLPEFQPSTSDSGIDIADSDVMIKIETGSPIHEPEVVEYIHMYPFGAVTYYCDIKAMLPTALGSNELLIDGNKSEDEEILPSLKKMLYTPEVASEETPPPPPHLPEADNISSNISYQNELQILEFENPDYAEEARCILEVPSNEVPIEGINDIIPTLSEEEESSLLAEYSSDQMDDFSILDEDWLEVVESQIDALDNLLND